MLDKYRTELIAGLATAVAGQSAQPQSNGGRATARGLLDLMQETIGTLPPMEIIEVSYYLPELAQRADVTKISARHPSN